MKDSLAEKILAKTMDWDNETLRQELNRLQIMSALKYDQYQQFSNGKQFIESLALWLKRFSKDDRQETYLFVKENLVFISEREMQQLISVAYDELVKAFIVKQSKDCNNSRLLDNYTKKQLYQYYLRKTLFLGLSDGAHMDFFRRCNNFLSNEQVFMHYDISDEKYEGMKKELQKDLSEIYEKAAVKEEDFLNFVLIDDFSASGISYVRYDYEEAAWKGKLVKFIENVLLKVTKTNNFNISVILYVATPKAVETIRGNLELFFKEKRYDINFTVQAVQYVSGVKLDEKQEELLKKDFELHNHENYETFIDSHFAKGNLDKPYHGFNGCSLPLVLYHNTPNNSFPVLWHSWHEKNSTDLMIKNEALFPRVTRHKEY